MTPEPPARRWTRAGVGAVLTPVVFITLWWAPLPLPNTAGRLAPIASAVLVAWISEVVPISVTALLIGPTMIMAGVTDKRAALLPYASPILFIFVGGFFIAKAMQVHGLDRRLAVRILAFEPVGRSGRRTRAAMMATGVALSMWISNTATCAILTPILLGLLSGDGGNEARRRKVGGLLAVAYACSVGGLGTPVGSPPNAITLAALEQAGVQLTFVDWMLVGLPAAALLSVLVFVYMQRVGGAPKTPDRGSLPRPEALGDMSRAEKVTALSFGLAVVGWVTPGVATALQLPAAATLKAHLPAGAVAVVASSLLFMIPRGRGQPRVLTWPEAARIDWGLIFLFGGGLSLGKQIFDTGLAAALGDGFIAATGVTELWTLVALTTVFTLFFTEACSNTATASMLAPLVIGVAMQLGVSPVPPALAVGLAASCAFMLPIATGPNAVVYGTGEVSLPRMMRTGVGLNFLSAAVIVALLYVICSALGWDSATRFLGVSPPSG